MNKITAVIPQGNKRNLEIKESLRQHSKKVIPIIEIGPNPSKNRNNGIKKAKTNLVAFLNAHTVLTNSWPEKVEEFFKEYPNIDIVGGPQLTSKSSSTFERASGYALSSIFGAAEASTRYKTNKLNLKASEKQITSANLICKSHVFKKVKFDENLWPGEDPKFISDAKNLGFKVAYSPDIVVYNKRRKNIPALAKQIFNYGFTRTRKESLKQTLQKPLFLIPALFLIYLSFLPTLLFFSLILIFPLIVYVLLSLSFSIYESILNNDFKAMPVIPIIFITIHISYGLGFIHGLITK